MTPEEKIRFYADFGQRVRAARETAGFTQRELADRLGLTRSSVANIEAGRQRALLHVAAAVAETTGTRPADLVPDHIGTAVSGSIARDLRRLSDPNREAVEMLLRRAARTAADAAHAAG